MTDNNPVVSLTIEKPQRLTHIQKWADLADALGFPDSSIVELSISGNLSVRAYLAQTSVPDLGVGAE